MERSFEVLVQEADSVMAAHAIARTLSERRKLLSRADIEVFVNCAVNGDPKAKAFALTGLDLIRVKQRRALAEISDRKAEEYIFWLSAFALKRAARGRLFSPDRGKTLLAELRQVATTRSVK